MAASTKTPAKKKTGKKKGGSRKKGDYMRVFMRTLKVSGGIVGGQFLGGKLPIADPKMKAVGLALIGIVGGAHMADWEDVFVGIASGGVVNGAQIVFPALAQPIQGMGALTKAQMKIIESAVADGAKMSGYETLGNTEDISGYQTLGATDFDNVMN